MNTGHSLHEIIYVSRLAPETPINTVVQIAKRSRVSNKPMQITGVLVFDGERFCQYIEGDVKDITQLFERISADTRHTDIQMLHQGAIPERYFSQFSMGYATVPEHDMIGKVADEHGIAARTVFMGMSALVDFGP